MRRTITGLSRAVACPLLTPAASLAGGMPGHPVGSWTLSGTTLGREPAPVRVSGQSPVVRSSKGTFAIHAGTIDKRNVSSW